MMMINVPWHFKVDDFIEKKKGKEKTGGRNHFSAVSFSSSVYRLNRFHTNTKQAMIITLISQRRGELNRCLFSERAWRKVGEVEMLIRLEHARARGPNCTPPGAASPVLLVH